MSPEGTVFPLYRKYANGRNFFKIINPQAFEEVQMIGGRKVIKVIEARQYFEKHFIGQLVNGTIGIAITKEEYETAKADNQK
jgi:hypothetical protein